MYRALQSETGQAEICMVKILDPLGPYKLLTPMLCARLHALTKLRLARNPLDV